MSYEFNGDIEDYIAELTPEMIKNAFEEYGFELEYKEDVFEKMELDKRFEEYRFTDKNKKMVYASYNQMNNVIKQEHDMSKIFFSNRIRKDTYKPSISSSYKYVEEVKISNGLSGVA